MITNNKIGDDLVVDDTIYYCRLTGDLDKNKAYGLSLEGSGSVTGYFAPIKLQTRISAVDSEAGPVIDTNDVFDSIFVIQAPLTVTLSTSIYAFDISSGNNKPGDTFTADFTITFTT